MTKLWANLTQDQIQEIVEGAGEKESRWISFIPPFFFKETLVFGGHCGLCGKWNWRWCQKGFEWTAPCKDCDVSLEETRKMIRQQVIEEKANE